MTPDEFRRWNNQDIYIKYQELSRLRAIEAAAREFLLVANHVHHYKGSLYTDNLEHGTADCPCEHAKAERALRTALEAKP